MLSRCKRDDTRGGSHYETLWLRNHPPRNPLRDPAALLTKEGSLQHYLNNVFIESSGEWKNERA